MIWTIAELPLNDELFVSLRGGVSVPKHNDDESISATIKKEYHLTTAKKDASLEELSDYSLFYFFVVF